MNHNDNQGHFMIQNIHPYMFISMGSVKLKTFNSVLNHVKWLIIIILDYACDNSQCFFAIKTLNLTDIIIIVSSLFQNLA